MPHATGRVDVHILPVAVDAPLAAAWITLTDRGVAEGWWTPEGEPGLRAEALIEGGFARARATVEDGVRFVANGLGGFQVRCPSCGAGLARAWGPAMSAWRVGGARDLTCPACGAHRDLADLDLRPPAGFFRASLHLADVGRVVVRSEALAALEADLGPLRTVVRRVG